VRSRPLLAFIQSTSGPDDLPSTAIGLCSCLLLTEATKQNNLKDYVLGILTRSRSKGHDDSAHPVAAGKLADFLRLSSTPKATCPVLQHQHFCSAPSRWLSTRHNGAKVLPCSLEQAIEQRGLMAVSREVHNSKRGNEACADRI